MSRGSLTLEQLIALTDEMAAMARIGVPLELGLRELGRDLPGRLGQVMRSLEQDLASGQSLSTAMANSPAVFPAAYQAMVLAGLQAGHLTLALECIAQSTRRVAEVLRNVRIALFYPLMVLILAYLVLVAFTVIWSPVLIHFYERTSLSTLPLFNWLSTLSGTSQWWAPVLALIVVLPLAVWYYRSFHSSEHPGQSMRHSARVATFSELLASMVERGMPLTQALPLAGDALGNDRLRLECRRWTDQLERGERIAPSAGEPRVLSDWLIWLLRHGHDSAHLSRNLRHTAEAYRADVWQRARWFSRTFPLLVTAIVGGAAVLITAISILGPWFYVLYHLTAA